MALGSGSTLVHITYSPLNPLIRHVAIVCAARNLLLIKCFRPDRLLQQAAVFAKVVFETDLSNESNYDLNTIVSDGIQAATPLAFVSVTGYDAGYRIENLVQSTGIKCTSVAMGSQEGFTLAD